MPTAADYHRPDDRAPFVRCDHDRPRRDLGFDPILVSYGLRFHSNAAVPCGTYEIYLEPERQEIPQDRVIPRDEIATREKAGYEAEQVMRYLGMGPKR